MRGLLAVAALACSSLAACVAEPATYQLDVSWTTSSHGTAVTDDDGTIQLSVTEPDGIPDFAPGQPGYAGSYRLAVVTTATTVSVCAQPGYESTLTVEPPPWCQSNCEEYDKPHWEPIGPRLCRDVALDRPDVSAALALSVYD